MDLSFSDAVLGSDCGWTWRRSARAVLRKFRSATGKNQRLFQWGNEWVKVWTSVTLCHTGLKKSVLDFHSIPSHSCAAIPIPILVPDYEHYPFSFPWDTHRKMWNEYSSILFYSIVHRRSHVVARDMRVDHLSYPIRTRNRWCLPVSVPDPHRKFIPDPTPPAGIPVTVAYPYDYHY